ncbi:Hydantoin utilization A [Paramuricea clavata]|uniref:Hydantoin utilization A n=1 Tax=Paramuricea clavata TaxID=317549 RepID=A0A6S7G751_PARCT|nr:Hydantoin utilization A [Paramuricea clavata]
MHILISACQTTTLLQFVCRSVTTCARCVYFTNTVVVHILYIYIYIGAKHIVVCGIFSTICVEQEVAVGEMIKTEYPEASVTLSHQVANFGLLERENSSILNESLKPLSKTAISAFTQAVKDAGLNCPVFFTQNDGTIISAEKSSQFPVLTFSSGPTNSMRGAAFLSRNQDAIVVDIGGTTTDVGVLVNGFPRPASFRVKCAGVMTNFRMPDVFSCALGGGSIVSNEGKEPVVGPNSVGYELITKSLVYGGSTSTTTDFAVAAGLCSIGDSSRVAHLDSSLVSSVVLTIRQLLEDSIDQVKVKAESQPVILVGGGSVLVDVTKSLQGASAVMKPEHFEVANAVGAALSQVSGVVDHVVDISTITREKALADGQSLAITRAIDNGAQAETVAIVEKSETQLAYLKGGATRVQVKAVGDLAVDDIGDQFHCIPSASSKEGNKHEVCEEIDREEPSLGEGKARGGEEVRRPLTVNNVNPYVEESSGAWLLNEYDVNCIATGAGILSCGGGGNPYLGKLTAILTLQSGKEIRVIHPDSVPKNGLILPVAFMGAPSVIIEKLIGGDELQLAAEKMQELLICDEKDIEISESARGVKYVTHLPELQSTVIPDDRKIVGLMSAEIGGMNSIEPLILGAKLGLPVLDCDGMGRAFPELDMFLPHIHGLPSCPSVIVGSRKSSEAMTYAATAKDLENDLRELIVSKMGCLAGLACAPLTAEDLRKNTVMFSMSRAWRLGNAVKLAQKEKRCPVDAVLESQNGKLLISGKGPCDRIENLPVFVLTIDS